MLLHSGKIDNRRVFMVQVNTTDIRGGLRVEVEGQPYTVVSNEFVKPGKGQSFNRIKLKHLLTGRSIERTFKSGDRLEVADVLDTQMRLLYKDQEGAVFMDDSSFEQYTIPHQNLGSVEGWLKEDLLYDIIFYKGAPVSVEPPTFMELKIIETAPGVRGDTASGRVLKPALLETGAQTQVPIFVEQEEIIKVDTRNGEYVSRVS
jgi:elongation factor P